MKYNVVYVLFFFSMCDYTRILPLLTHSFPTRRSSDPCLPKEWYQHYNAAGHYRHDPCVAHSRRTADPFLWSDVSRESLEAPARLVMHEATEFGLRQGICVPVHAPFASPSVVPVSGEFVDLAPTTRHVVRSEERRVGKGGG